MNHRPFARIIPLALLLTLLPLAACESQGAYRLDAPAPAENGPPAGLIQRSDRAVAHRAAVDLEVADVGAARARIERDAQELGGFAQVSAPMRLLVQLPAVRIPEAIERLAAVGRITRRQFAAEDVTAQRDEGTERIARLRERIADLQRQLADEPDAKRRTALTGDIGTATLELERLEAAARAQSQRVALVPVEITLQLDPALACVVGSVPVEWLRELPQVLTQPRTVDISQRVQGHLWQFVDVDLPEGFVVIQKRDYVTRAVDANATHLRVSRHDNLRTSDLAFWKAAAKRMLTETQGLRIAEEKAASVAGGKPGHLYFCLRKVGDQELTYVLGLAVSGKRVYTFEVWGLAAEVGGLCAAVETSFGSMRFGAAEVD